MVSQAALAGAGLAAAVALTSALLTVEHPPVNRRTVLAAFPWVVVAGCLHALAALGAYPPLVARFASFPAAVAVVYVLGALSWAALLQVAVMRDYPVDTGRYLAAAGTGAAFVLLLALVVWRGLDGQGLLWLSAAPLLAAVLATVAFLALGVLDVTSVGATRLVGFAVVFGYALLGMSVAVTVRVYDAPAGNAALELLLDLGTRAPTLPGLGSTWPAAVAVLLVGVGLTVTLARLVRRDDTYGLLALLAVGAVGLGPAVGRLLVSVFG